MADRGTLFSNRAALGALCLVGAVLAFAFGQGESESALVYVVAGLLLLAAVYQFAVLAIAAGQREGRN